MIEPKNELLGPILILGGGGMIGRAWRERLTRSGIGFDAPSRSEMDLSRPGSLAPVAKKRWRTVINGAGSSLGEGAGALARACAAGGARLLHHGSAEVFAGGTGRTISVRHVRDAADPAGRAAGLAEELIEISGAKWIIVRSSWVYAPWGRNFVRATASALMVAPTIGADAEERSRPTSAEQLVKMSVALLRQDVPGIWHVTDGGECSRHELACEIAANLGAGGRVEAGAGGEARSRVLDLSRTEGLLGPMEDWRVLLAEVMRRLE